MTRFSKLVFSVVNVEVCRNLDEKKVCLLTNLKCFSRDVKMPGMARR